MLCLRSLCFSNQILNAFCLKLTAHCLKSFILLVFLFIISLNCSHCFSVDDPIPPNASTIDEDYSYHPGPKNYTDFWAVQISGTVEDAKRIAQEHGFVYFRQVMPSIFLFKHHKRIRQSPHRRMKRAARQEPKIIWFERQEIKKRVKRDLFIKEPRWHEMWYLNRNYRYGSVDMNVVQVWELGYTGKGVVVTILDDGLEITHADLSLNYDSKASFDVNDNDLDPTPKFDSKRGNNSNRHGTRCAGEIAAVANNGVCGIGVAFEAKIGGVRMLDGDVTDSIEAISLSHALDHVDVYSASWGPEDNGHTVDGPGILAQRAFRNGIIKGRNGLGAIFVWASGNGGKDNDNCNCDGYTNSIYTLGVSSATESGNVPWYAEKCSSTLAVAYSSGNPLERAVVTTDLNNTCTNTHSGTSASAPLAAGIVALVLSANRSLTWRDMQHLVVYTARPDPLNSNEWRTNGAGRVYSPNFGYGLMDAEAMVKLAIMWRGVGQQRNCSLNSALNNGHAEYIRSGSSQIFKIETVACDRAPDRVIRYLEHVQAKITLSSTNRGEVEIWLVSPSGTVSVLLTKRPKDAKSAGFHAWPFMSVHFWGENPQGRWKLTVWSGSSRVTIRSWTLVLYGTYEKPHFYNFKRKKSHVSRNSRKYQEIQYGKPNYGSPNNWSHRRYPSSYWLYLLSISSLLTNQILSRYC